MAKRFGEKIKDSIDAELDRLGLAEYFAMEAYVAEEPTIRRE